MAKTNVKNIASSADILELLTVVIATEIPVTALNNKKF
jgi:hypothetical protein